MKSNPHELTSQLDLKGSKFCRQDWRYRGSSVGATLFGRRSDMRILSADKRAINFLNSSCDGISIDLDTIFNISDETASLLRNSSVEVSCSVSYNASQFNTNNLQDISCHLKAKKRSEFFHVDLEGYQPLSYHEVFSISTQRGPALSILLKINNISFEKFEYLSHKCSDSIAEKKWFVASQPTSLGSLLEASEPIGKSIILSMKRLLGLDLSPSQDVALSPYVGIADEKLLLILEDMAFAADIRLFDDRYLLFTLDLLTEPQDRTCSIHLVSAPIGICCWELAESTNMDDVDPKTAPFKLVHANELGRRFFGFSNPIGAWMASLMPYAAENDSIVRNFLTALKQQEVLVLEQNQPHEGIVSLADLADANYNIVIRPCNKRIIAVCWRDITATLRSRELCQSMHSLLDAAPIMCLLLTKSLHIAYLNSYGKQLIRCPTDRNFRLSSLTMGDLFPSVDIESDAREELLSQYETKLTRIDGTRAAVMLTLASVSASTRLETESLDSSNQMYVFCKSTIKSTLSDLSSKFSSSRAFAAFVRQPNVAAGQVDPSAAECELAAKKDFLATVSHEIRTPLNGIVGSAELLQVAVTDSWQLNLVKSISGCSKTLLQIINDILDFAKIDSRKMELEQQPFNVVDVVDAAVSVVSANLRRKKQYLIYTICSNTPTYIVGDAVRTKQIILNILSNASKFTPTESDIEIGLCVCEYNTSGQPSCLRDSAFNECSSADLHGGSFRRIFGGSIPSKSHHFRLFVRDTGSGMTQSQVSRIFTPFTQARNVGSSRGLGLHDPESGTGLGLSIVRKLLEIMGGGCSVRSVKDVGSCFNVWFPCDVATSAPFPEKSSFSDIRVALSASNKAKQASISSMVTHLGAQITIVADFRVALQNSDLCIVYPKDNNDLSEKLSLFAHKDNIPPRIDGELSRRVLLILPPWTSTEVQQLASEQCEATCIFSPITVSAVREAIRGVFRGASRSTPNGSPGSLRASGKYPLRILVVEDNPTNRFVLVQMLQRVGLTPKSIIQAENGEQALERLKESSFDIVFMDIHMPIMSGWEAARHLREKPEDFQHVGTIIALTAASTLEEREQSMKNMDMFLSKPLQLQKLVDTLNQCCQRLKLDRHFMTPLEASRMAIQRIRMPNSATQMDGSLAQSSNSHQQQQRSAPFLKQKDVSNWSSRVLPSKWVSSFGETSLLLILALAVLLILCWTHRCSIECQH